MGARNRFKHAHITIRTFTKTRFHKHKKHTTMIYMISALQALLLLSTGVLAMKGPFTAQEIKDMEFMDLRAYARQLGVHPKGFAPQDKLVEVVLGTLPKPKAMPEPPLEQAFQGFQNLSIDEPAPTSSRTSSRNSAAAMVVDDTPKVYDLELIRRVWGEYGVMGLDLIVRSDSDNKVEFSSQHKAQALMRTLDAAGYPTGQLLEDVLEVRTTLGNEPTETDIREAMKDLRTFPHNHTPVRRRDYHRAPWATKNVCAQWNGMVDMPKLSSISNELYGSRLYAAAAFLRDGPPKEEVRFAFFSG